MSRLYVAVFRAVAVTAVQDFFEISPAANKPCRIVRLKLSQYSDAGDAADELLSYSIFRVPATATSGSGGSTPAISPVDSTGQAAGCVVEANNTTVATTSGTLVELLADTFNIRTGLDLPIEPEIRPQAVNATLLVVRLNAAPADSLTMNGCAWIEED
jgi:hypothetical protein